jgi:hypothetical protein
VVLKITFRLVEKPKSSLLSKIPHLLRGRERAGGVRVKKNIQNQRVMFPPLTPLPPREGKWFGRVKGHIFMRTALIDGSLL